MCKEFIYKILYWERLDWLKREKDWKWDKIDFYLFISFTIPFILVIIFGKMFLQLFAVSIFIGGSLGWIRRVKSSPGDIESKLMGWTFCLQLLIIPLISLNLFLG